MRTQHIYTTFFRLTILRQYHEFTTSHSYRLERLTSAAPRDGAYLPFRMLGLCCPLGLACPSFCYEQVVCSNSSYITHSVPPTTITKMLTLLQLTSWMFAMTYKYMHIYNLWTFFLFSCLTSKQVTWPWTLMSGELCNSFFWI